MAAVRRQRAFLQICLLQEPGSSFTHNIWKTCSPFVPGSSCCCSSKSRATKQLPAEARHQSEDPGPTFLTASRRRPGPGPGPHRSTPSQRDLLQINTTIQ
ncbi:uncharacterized protein V6R79_011468 [Siganus canaliculatus]